MKLDANVSSFGKLGLVYPCVDLFVDFVEGPLERGVDGAEGWKCGRQPWADQTIIGACEEQGFAEAELGDAIAEAVGETLDQSMQAQASQLIGDGPLGDRFGIAAGQGGKMTAQIG